MTCLSSSQKVYGLLFVDNERLEDKLQCILSDNCNMCPLDNECSDIELNNLLKLRVNMWYKFPGHF